MKTFKQLFQSAPQIGDMACTIDDNGNLTLVLCTNKQYSNGTNMKIQVLRNDAQPQEVGQSYWQQTDAIRSQYSPTTELAKRENLDDRP